jgi:hypothetical protein
MFGMLDYRAYKLAWLICSPLRLVMWIAEWSSIVIAIMISASLDYSLPIRIVVALAISVGAAVVLYFIRRILFWFIIKGFFTAMFDANKDRGFGKFAALSGNSGTFRHLRSKFSLTHCRFGKIKANHPLVGCTL